MTIFQKILDKEIPAKIVYEDDHCMAFHDIDPQAPIHILLIPRKPIQSLADVSPGDEALLGHLMVTLTQIARSVGLKEYRVVSNCGAGAGQSVFHLHFHLLGGRAMEWPPG